MSAWIFHCLWNRWQRALPLCGPFLKRAQTNSTRPPRAVQIRIHSWSHNTQASWLVSSSRCFLGAGEGSDLSKKPRPSFPQLLLLLWGNTEAETMGNLIPPACPRSALGSCLDSQKLVLQGPLPTSGAKSTRQRAPVIPPAGSGPTEGQMYVADRLHGQSPGQQDGDQGVH